MIISGKELFKYAHGCVDISEEKGAVRLLRFEKEQLDYYRDNKIYLERALSSASVFLELFTDAESVSLTVTIDNLCSFDTVDIVVDGVLIHSVPYSGNGELKIEKELSEGKKNLRIILPLYASVLFTDLELGNASFAEAVEAKGKRVLFLGDSITQGNGASTSCCSYVWTLTHLYGFNTLNQGIGGYCYDPKIPLPKSFSPELIFVAYGTNGYKSSRFTEKVKGFYEVMKQRYPDIPIIAISPIYRVDPGNEKLCEVHGIIKEAARDIKSFRLIDGLKAVPHLDTFFADTAHPARHGHLFFASRIASELGGVL
ncbi:MAG: SGNH/GDSL hydrolase family protein [Ruminococcaceae bacterium]|nr:SGNH/GDSL hydrolase family protein [Oscillospiraceae bacterium]